MPVLAKKTTRIAPVAFCRIAVKSCFIYQGQKYIKFAPKRGMTSKGQTINLPDNAMVVKA